MDGKTLLLSLLLFAFHFAPQASIAGSSNSAGIPPSLMTGTQRREFENFIDNSLQEIADHLESPTSGIYKMRIKTTLDIVNDNIIIDLGREIGPISDSGDIEYVRQYLLESAKVIIDDKVKCARIKFVYGGLPIENYHSEYIQDKKQSDQIFINPGNEYIERKHHLL